jgi:hypothetical protein
MPAPPARVRYDFVMTFARPQRIRLPLKIVPRSLNELEARAGIEPAQEEDSLIGLQAVAASREGWFAEAPGAAVCGSSFA